MTLRNSELASRYMVALAEGDKKAKAASFAVDSLLETIKSCGFEFPIDDRCMNIEVEIYRLILENG